MKKTYLQMIGGAWLGGSVAIIAGFSVLDWQWWVIILPTAIFFIKRSVKPTDADRLGGM